MTLFQRDLENQEIGIQQGIAREQKKRIADMLIRGKKPQEIADFCDYPLSLVLEVQKDRQLMVTA